MDGRANRLGDLRRRIGVTRLANVTGLDRIGLPVVAAIRPLSRNLTVSFGKGRDAESAALSALMESAELFYSETPPGPLRRGSYAELRGAGAVDPHRLDRIDSGADLSGVSFDWIAGEELSGDRSVLVPWHMVAMDYSLEGRKAERHLKFGATGLAAGFDAGHAILHALCEVIERDAHQAWNIGGDRARAATLVDQATMVSEGLPQLASMVKDAGLDLLVWDLSDGSAIPCYLAEIFDSTPRAPTAYVQGIAANLSPAMALHKAIMEAIQIRLTYISGSRDDLDWSDYGARYGRTVENRRWIAAHLRPARCFPEEHGPLPSDAAAIAEIQARLVAAGRHQIICVKLAGPSEPVHVVKIIVPLLRDIRDIAAPSPQLEAVPA